MITLPEAEVTCPLQICVRMRSSGPSCWTWSINTKLSWSPSWNTRRLCAGGRPAQAAVGECWHLLVEPQLLCASALKRTHLNVHPDSFQEFLFQEFISRNTWNAPLKACIRFNLCLVALSLPVSTGRWCGEPVCPTGTTCVEKNTRRRPSCGGEDGRRKRRKRRSLTRRIIRWLMLVCM